MTYVILVDDDDLFRESLTLNLIDAGYEVTSFSNGRDALDYLQNGGAGDVVLLDWRMPRLSGHEVLRHMRRAGIGIPVIFLTILSDDVFEDAALEAGAVDFIDKSRRLPILLRRLERIVEGIRPSADSKPRHAGSLQVAQLELRYDQGQALWAGRMIDLTQTEFSIVALLAEKEGQDVRYREIYDIVRGERFISGRGAEGYRANVRTFIKRIRRKFRDVDADFDCIENYAGYGYRWRA